MHSFMNIKRSAQISNEFWDISVKAGMADMVVVGLGGGRHRDLATGREFVNMSSYSYLGLDTHPAIVQAAADAVLAQGALNTSSSRMRIRFTILQDTETALSELFNVEAVTTASCAMASWVTLPLVASGLFTDDKPPLMVFDKNAHFSLNAMKANVADEAPVVTIGHNDVDALEDLCRKHDQVAYVADGVYSTGGKAPVTELLRLQERYGLFLIFDEAHSISTLGDKGRGVVLQEMGELNDRTVIVTSLNKGFGATGGAIFLGPRGSKRRLNTALRTGPLMWSQRVNTAGLGAIFAATQLHHTTELTRLQRQLQANVNLFDSLVHTDGSGDGLPIRFVPVNDEHANVQLGEALLEHGYYATPVFFPIVGRGKAGLRLMLRANMTSAEIEEFCSLLKTLRDKYTARTMP